VTLRGLGPKFFACGLLASETTLTSERQEILRELLGSCDISGRAINAGWSAIIDDVRVNGSEPLVAY
jgi:hypothetical protein